MADFEYYCHFLQEEGWIHFCKQSIKASLLTARITLSGTFWLLRFIKIMIWKYSLSSLPNFINSMHIYVTADWSNFFTYNRVLKFVNLRIRDFDTWSSISISLFQPLCNWFWPTEMRPHGWWVCFPHSRVITPIAGTSVKLCVKWTLIPLCFMEKNSPINVSFALIKKYLYFIKNKFPCALRWLYFYYWYFISAWKQTSMLNWKWTLCLARLHYTHNIVGICT